jgi:hypothetical protein
VGAGALAPGADAGGTSADDDGGAGVGAGDGGVDDGGGAADGSAAEPDGARLGAISGPRPPLCTPSATGCSLAWSTPLVIGTKR